eukprot:TRINITY_DN2986_c0_g2_i1.p2 TRINITY_DN2986_c0_g2~~TRINITY_DN2986_c0_g2_i1.p2  ORF type:complete len:104 (+),score=28.88 TRINITY_DN2986_c0_g2_i1:198-509(+)
MLSPPAVIRTMFSESEIPEEASYEEYGVEPEAISEMVVESSVRVRDQLGDQLVEVEAWEFEQTRGFKARVLRDLVAPTDRRKARTDEGGDWTATKVVGDVNVP